MTRKEIKDNFQNADLISSQSSKRRYGDNQGQCRLACPLILDDVRRNNATQQPKNNVGTKRSKIARLGAKMTAFWEECKNECKISPTPKAQ